MWRSGQLPSPQALAEEDELWGLDPTAREQLCRLWMAKLQEPLHAKLAQLCDEYEKLVKTSARAVNGVSSHLRL